VLVLLSFSLGLLHHPGSHLPHRYSIRFSQVTSLSFNP